jgi:hypothetical protein
MYPGRAFQLIIETIYRLDPDPNGVAHYSQVLSFQGPGIEAEASDLPALAGLAHQWAQKIPSRNLDDDGSVPNLEGKVAFHLMLRYGNPEVRVMHDRYFSDGTVAKGGYPYHDVVAEAERFAALARPELLAQLGGAA